MPAKSPFAARWLRWPFAARGEPDQFVQDDRDAISEMGAAILKLQGQVASLQRDLVTTVSGILKRGPLEQGSPRAASGIVNGISLSRDHICLSIVKHRRASSSIVSVVLILPSFVRLLFATFLLSKGLARQIRQCKSHVQCG